MRELGLTGLSEDGRFLVAHDALTDESFHIPTDLRLTSLLDAAPGSASTGTTTQPDHEAGTREPTMEVTLNPREIQNRIRRGESPEQVAEESGMSVDRVRGFAIPVIAEREYIVEQARITSVRRLHATGAPGMQLGSLVDAALGAQGASAESAAWDSWRREDGRWTVIVAADGAAEPATFLFDTKGRYVLPADDAAHALIGDLALQDGEPTTGDMAIANAVRDEETTERIARSADPVAETVEVHLDVEIDLPIDELLPKVDEIPLDLPVPEEVLERSAPVSSLKEARDRRALEQLAMSVEAEVSAPTEAADVEITEEQDLAVPSTPHPSKHAPSKKRHERRRVPSWDEIMFGGATRE
ncbi:MAG TPA: septation protein SepH [Aeromicrobium sp.]|nr:septation protein SepH [Aeromicrobium sp.]